MNPIPELPIPPVRFQSLLKYGWLVLVKNFRLLFGIHAVLFIPAYILMDVCAVISYNADQTWWDNYSLERLPATEAPPFNAADTVAGVVVLITAFFLFPLSYSATILAVDAMQDQRPTSIRSTLAAAWHKLLPLLDTLIWSTLYMTLGLLFLVLPAIYLYVRYLVRYQIVTMEHVRGRQALRRSGELLKGKMWTAFAMAVTLISLSILAAVLTEFLPKGPAYIIIDPVVQALVCAFDSTVVALLYIACRQREAPAEEPAVTFEV